MGDTLLGYPDRVKERPDGSYYWYCSIEREYYAGQLEVGLKACLLIALFVLAYGAFLAFRFGNWNKDLLIVGGCVAVYLAIVAGVFRLFGLGTREGADPKERYELTDTYVKSGTGRSSTFFYFKKVKLVRVTAGYVELQGRRLSFRVYVPAEDLTFVKDYILSRIPGDAEIVYD